MLLDGIHHITAITADARQNVDFYARLLGLRFLKKTVNYDAPDVYHLYYGDELGSPGSILTFFEFPGAPIGTAGSGMIWRLSFRVKSRNSLDFWKARLVDEGIDCDLREDVLRFRDPEGLSLELVVAASGDLELAARSEVPEEHALRGFDGVRAYASAPQKSHELLTATLGFAADGAGSGYRVAGDNRHSFYSYDKPPSNRPMQGAGTVHHIAWAVPDSEHARWHQRLVADGAAPTEIIDRTYFRSIYFREPSGVLFELATLGPGFTVDESPDKLGETLVLPERLEPLRETLEQTLTPLSNPRSARVNP